MTEPRHHKPTPARTQGPEAGRKPTPARDLNGASSPPAPDADLPEAVIEVDGTPWTVRVLGRSGSASGRSPPLLLLGFWREGDHEKPSLEALVVARAMSDLSTEALRDALSRAEKPGDPGHEKPFFADAAQTRRRSGTRG